MTHVHRLPCRACYEWFQCSSHPSPVQICSPGRKQLKEKKREIFYTLAPPNVQQDTLLFSLNVTLNEGTHLRECRPGWRCRARRGSERCWLPPSARSCPAGDTLAPARRWPAGGGCPWSAGWRYRSCSCTWSHEVGENGVVKRKKQRS